MASLTLGAKDASVNVRLLVTSDTFPRGAPERLVDMARSALQRGMLPYQGEDLTMIKIRHIPRAIMTTNTVGIIALNVLRHERGIVSRVTINTGLHGWVEIIRRRIGVTLVTGQRDAFKRL